MEANYDLCNRVLDCVSMVIDDDNYKSDDDEIVLMLLESAKAALSLPKLKRRRVWMKSWRHDRKTSGSVAFLTNELHLGDQASYINYLRMDKDRFDMLLSLIKGDLQRSNTFMRDAISPAEKLALTLRFLATGESFKSTGYQTKLSSSFICNTIPEVCKAIWKNLKSRYLKFPSSIEEWERIAEKFSVKWQFPHCIGALDGKHVNFRFRTEYGTFYCNYKGMNSIILMALVDANCRFIYIDVGCNGRTNDAGAFAQSKLKNVLDNAATTLPPSKLIGRERYLPYAIVADDAFPLQKHIMKPYPYSTSSKEKKVFNERHSRARHVVEHTFGILSNRFSVFQTVMNVRVEKVEIITLACCALHNFLQQNDKNYISNYATTSSSDDDPDVEGVNNSRSDEAEKIRQSFTAYFNEEGRMDWISST